MHSGSSSGMEAEVQSLGVVLQRWCFFLFCPFRGNDSPLQCWARAPDGEPQAGASSNTYCPQEEDLTAGPFPF